VTAAAVAAMTVPGILGNLKLRTSSNLYFCIPEFLICHNQKRVRSMLVVVVNEDYFRIPPYVNGIPEYTVINIVTSQLCVFYNHGRMLQQRLLSYTFTEYD